MQSTATLRHYRSTLGQPNACNGLGYWWPAPAAAHPAAARGGSAVGTHPYQFYCSWSAAERATARHEGVSSLEAQAVSEKQYVQLAREGATAVAFDVRRHPARVEKTVSLMRAARQNESLPVQQDLFIEGDVSNADSVKGAILTT